MKMLKMKHVKLFEQFMSSGSGMNPVILARVDYSKITEGGEAPHDFCQPNAYYVYYYTNGLPSELSFYDDKVKESSVEDPTSAADLILTGDQNGLYMLQHKGLVFRVDPNFSPEDYKNELEKFITDFNGNPGGYEEDNCYEFLENERMENILTPEFLAHCEAITTGSTTNIMKPRIELVFKVDQLD
jgi:hypothetical protein